MTFASRKLPVTTFECTDPLLLPQKTNMANLLRGVELKVGWIAQWLNYLTVEPEIWSLISLKSHSVLPWATYSTSPKDAPEEDNSKQLLSALYLENLGKDLCKSELT